MKIDVHAHVFPDMRGPSGYATAEDHLAVQQASLASFWGRMRSSTTEERYKPLSGEDIDFRIDRFGKYRWKKHGRDCWLQRFPSILEYPAWSPEQMLACMDEALVDIALLHTGYMEDNYCYEYYGEVVREWAGRFLATVTVNFDARANDACLERELEKLAVSRETIDARAAFNCFPRLQPFDHPRAARFWEALRDLGMPHIVITGFGVEATFRRQIGELWRIAEQYPTVDLVITHLGGQIVDPGCFPSFDPVGEMLPLLRKPNVWFEVGYVLAFEDESIWNESSRFPFPAHTNIIKRIYDHVGADRLLWQSDMPHLLRICTYKQSLELLSHHMSFLSGSEIAAITGGNASRLLRLA